MTIARAALSVTYYNKGAIIHFLFTLYLYTVDDADELKCVEFKSLIIHVNIMSPSVVRMFQNVRQSPATFP